MDRHNPNQNINQAIESIFRQLKNIKETIDNNDKKIDKLQNSTKNLNISMDSLKQNMQQFCYNQERSINTKLNDILKEIKSHINPPCNFIILFTLLL
jgi:chromosome segregation ATPase